MLTGGIRGSDQLRRAARDLRQIADKGMVKKIRAGMEDAVSGLSDEIKEEIPKVFPTRYAAVLGQAMRVQPKTTLRTSQDVGVTVRIYAKGARAERDVKAMNLGILRHKLFGMPKWWYRQPVRHGFVDEPWKRLEVATREAIDRRLSEIATEFNVGG